MPPLSSSDERPANSPQVNSPTTNTPADATPTTNTSPSSDDPTPADLDIAAETGQISHPAGDGGDTADVNARVNNSGATSGDDSNNTSVPIADASGIDPSPDMTITVTSGPRLAPGQNRVWGIIDANLPENQEIMTLILRSLDLDGFVRMSQTTRYYRQLAAGHFGRHLIVTDDAIVSRTPQFGWVRIREMPLGWLLSQTDVLDIKTCVQDRVIPLAKFLGPHRVDYGVVMGNIVELADEEEAKEVEKLASCETTDDEESEVISTTAAQNDGNYSASCETYETPKDTKEYKASEDSTDVNKHGEAPDNAEIVMSEATMTEPADSDTTTDNTDTDFPEDEDLLATPRASVLNFWSERCRTPRHSDYVRRAPPSDMPVLEIPPAATPDSPAPPRRGPTWATAPRDPDHKTMTTAASLAVQINQLFEPSTVLNSKSEHTKPRKKSKGKGKSKGHDIDDRVIPKRPDTPRPPPPRPNARPSDPAHACPAATEHTEEDDPISGPTPISAHPGPSQCAPAPPDKRLKQITSPELNPATFDPLRRPPTPHPAHLPGGRVLKDRTVFFEVRDPKPADEPAVRVGYYYNEMRSYAQFKHQDRTDWRPGSYTHTDMPPYPPPRFVFPAPHPEPDPVPTTPTLPTPAAPVAGKKRGRPRHVPGRGQRTFTPPEPPHVSRYLPDIPQPDVLVRNWAAWESPSRPQARLTPACPQVGKCAAEAGSWAPPSAAGRWPNTLGPLMPFPPVPGRMVRDLPRGGWHFFSGRILGAQGGPPGSINEQFEGGPSPADRMIAERHRVMDKRVRAIAHYRRLRSDLKYIARALAEIKAETAAGDRLHAQRAARRDAFILREEALRARRARVQEARWRSMQVPRPTSATVCTAGISGNHEAATALKPQASSNVPHASGSLSASSQPQTSGPQAPIPQTSTSVPRTHPPPTPNTTSGPVPSPTSTGARNTDTNSVRGPILRIFHDGDGNSFPLPQLHNVYFTPRTTVIFINAATLLHPELHGCGCDADAAAWRPRPEQKIVFNVLYDPHQPMKAESIWAHLLRLAPRTGRKVLMFTPVFGSSGRHLSGTMDLWLPAPFIPPHLIQRHPPMAYWPMLEGRKFCPSNFVPLQLKKPPPVVVNPAASELFDHAIDNIAETLYPRIQPKTTSGRNTNTEASSSRNTLPPLASHLTPRGDRTQHPGDWSLVGFDALPAWWVGMPTVDPRGVITNRLALLGIDMARFHFLSLEQYRETVCLEDFCAEMIP